ncbi:MAG: hypothetical protein A2Z18_11535, partial [Armatimonadetes bacterium RBG_16_58_9]
ARNTLSSIVFSVFNALTSFLAVPYLKNRLGWDNYGILGTANTFVLYTQILTVVLVGTVFRFVTMCLAKDDVEGARGYFNTQFITALVFVMAFLPIAGAISLLTPAILSNIPAGQERNTQILFALVYLSFLLILLSNPFQVGQFVKQRFDVRNGIEIANQTVRYSTWLLLFAFFSPVMWHVGIGYVLGATVTLAATVAAFKRFTPQLVPSLSGFCKSKFLEMTRMGSWLMVSQLGVVLYLSIDPFIIFTMIGADASGKYYSILGLALMLRVLAATMNSLVVPMAIASYARQDWVVLVKNLARAVKFISLGMAIPLGILCGLSVPFITRWLGSDVAGLLSPLVWLLLAHNVINCGVEPLFAINLAANKVAVPGMVTAFGGVLKLAAAIALVRYTNLGIHGVAIAGLVSLTLKNAVFTPLYAGRVLNVSSAPFYTSLIPAVLVFGCLSASGYALAASYDLATYPRLLIVGLLLAGASVVCVYRLALGEDDRAFLSRLRARKQEEAV